LSSEIRPFPKKSLGLVTLSCAAKGKGGKRIGVSWEGEIQPEVKVLVKA
jgi:hypothetical protein